VEAKKPAVKKDSAKIETVTKKTQTTIKKDSAKKTVKKTAKKAPNKE